MFKNLFSKLGAKGDSKDPEPLSIRNLTVGSVFDYDLRTFKVEEAYEYDWGSNFFSREYKISDGKEVLFLSVEDDDQLELSISRKVKPRHLLHDLPEYIKRHEKPPTMLSYKDVAYIYDEESPGYFRNCKDDADKDASWTEFISWDYYDETERKTLTVERWEEDDFEASVGYTIEEYEISNLLPGPDQ